VECTIRILRPVTGVFGATRRKQVKSYGTLPEACDDAGALAFILEAVTYKHSPLRFRNHRTSCRAATQWGFRGGMLGVPCLIENFKDNIHRREYHLTTVDAQHSARLLPSTATSSLPHTSASAVSRLRLDYARSATFSAG